MSTKATRLRRSAAVFGGALALGLMGISAAASASGSAQNASGSANPYSPAYGHPYRHGVVPTRAQQAKMNAYAAGHTSGTSTGPETLAYGGGIGGVGVTSGKPQIYLVFWGSGWGNASTTGGNTTFGNDPYAGAPYLQNLFKGLGTGPSSGSQELWSGTMTQYCDGSVSFGATSCPSGSSLVGYPTGGGVLAGVLYDSSSVSATTYENANNIAQEAVYAANHFAKTSYRDAQFDILSPTGANPDNYLNSGFCAWHDYTGDGYSVTNVGSYGNVAFTNMPYVMDVGPSCGQNFVNSGTAGTLDGYSIVNGHEYAETITDQFPAGGWTNHQRNYYGGQEVGDECAWISSGSGAAGDVAMGTGSFAMQSIWSNDTNGCALSHPIVTGSGGGGGGGGNTVSVTPEPNQTSVWKTATSLQMSATDSGTNTTLTWGATGLPPGLSINSSNGLISGKPSRTGNYSVTVTATDNTTAHGSTGFTWTIKR